MTKADAVKILMGIMAVSLALQVGFIAIWAGLETSEDTPGRSVVTRFIALYGWFFAVVALVVHWVSWLEFRRDIKESNPDGPKLTFSVPFCLTVPHLIIVVVWMIIQKRAEGTWG